MQFAKWVPNSDGFGHTAPVKFDSNQSRAKVSRPSGFGLRPGRESKSTGSNTPPNPSVNRTANGLRPSSAGYLER
jgi:hypothetical protein